MSAWLRRRGFLLCQGRREGLVLLPEKFLAILGDAFPGQLPILPDQAQGENDEEQAWENDAEQIKEEFRVPASNCHCRCSFHKIILPRRERGGSIQFVGCHCAKMRTASHKNDYAVYKKRIFALYPYGYLELT